MRLSLTNVKNLDLGDKHLVARFELINPNDDEFQVSLICASAEGVVVDGKIRVSTAFEIFGCSYANRDLEILVDCELEVESDADKIESDEFRFDVARNGSLSTDTLPQLTQRETVLCLGEDLQVILTFAYK